MSQYVDDFERSREFMTAFRALFKGTDLEEFLNRMEDDNADLAYVFSSVIASHKTGLSFKELEDAYVGPWYEAEEAIHYQPEFREQAREWAGRDLGVGLFEEIPPEMEPDIEDQLNYDGGEYARRWAEEHYLSVHIEPKGLSGFDRYDEGHTYFRR